MPLKCGATYLRCVTLKKIRIPFLKQKMETPI